MSSNHRSNISDHRRDRSFPYVPYHRDRSSNYIPEAFVPVSRKISTISVRTPPEYISDLTDSSDEESEVNTDATMTTLEAENERRAINYRLQMDKLEEERKEMERRMLETRNYNNNVTKKSPGKGGNRRKTKRRKSKRKYLKKRKIISRRR
jgi:hypothetical protein